MNTLSGKKIVIVHDWLLGGGAEKVIEQLHVMFPDAPIYTSYCSNEWREKLGGKVVTGYLQHWPFSKARKLLPIFRQRWFQKLDLSEFDLIISSSGNGEAKFVRPKSSDPVHVCYSHSPTHFYWRHRKAYLTNPGLGFLNPLARVGLRLLIKPLSRKDYQAAQKVDHFIANSTHIQKDIEKYYNRKSTVIYPPVYFDRFSTKGKKAASSQTKHRSGFVTVGRLVPNKRVDILIKACNKLNLPLNVVGRGPELANLKRIAGPSITFHTNASDDDVVRLVSSAKAFLFASFEDFGISPVEAMSAGTPVIAYKAGGALDYVIEGKTGTFFEEQTVDSLINALENFNPSKFNPKNIEKHAEKFSDSAFRKQMFEHLEALYQQKSN